MGMRLIKNCNEMHLFPSVVEDDGALDKIIVGLNPPTIPIEIRTIKYHEKMDP